MRRLQFVTVVLLLAFTAAAHGQAPPDAGAAFTGWLHLIVGDPPAGSGDAPQRRAVLQDDDGVILAEVLMDENRARELSGQRVLVMGEPPRSSQASGPLVIDARHIQALPPAPGELAGAAAEVSGSQPWANILCRFADLPGTPHAPSWYAPLFGSAYPGLDHYWRQLSYDRIDLAGTVTTTQWYTLPYARSSYVYSSGGETVVEFTRLAQDCTAAADAHLYYPNFVGINLMFNGNLGCCAWGGGTTLTRDGQTRAYRVTWLPPWAHDHSTIAHEMGHGFGLPHSSGPSWDPPSGLNVYVSQWDVMSVSGGTCAAYDEDYGCIAPGTIAYHLDMDGWIPSAQRETVMVGQDKTITLEQTGLPQSSSNKLLAKVLIGNSPLRFYTVEARRFAGYDQSVPGQAVVIHEVFTQRAGNAGHALVVDGDDNHDVNDDGAMWLAGETFNDGDGISIEVLSAGATSFTARIINNSTPSPYPDPPTNIQTSGDADSITLEWVDNSYNELGFNIYRWAWPDFVYYDSVGADVTSYTDSGLGCGSTQFYQVSAYTSQFESERDEYAWVMGMTDPCPLALEGPPDGALLGMGPVTLRWSGGWGAVYFEVRLGTSLPPPTVAEDVEDSFYTARSLPGGVYYWQARGVNELGGKSAWSEVRTFTLASPASAAPQRHFFETATLTWNPVSWATGYHVQVARDAQFTDLVFEEKALPPSSLSVEPPLGLGAYYWRARALRPGGAGAWSVPERFTLG